MRLLILLVLLCAPAMSQAYTVSPLVLDINVEKRELQVRDITLTNHEAVTRIYPTVNEISVDENGEIKAFEYATNEDRTDTVTSWLEIGRGRIELQPNEVRTVPLTIRINPNAKPGLYHAFIGFPNAGTKDEAIKKSMSGRAPGTIVRIAIDQERTEFLRLENFYIDRFVTDTANDVVSYTVTNPGEAEISPRGEIIFYDNQGTELTSVPINTEALLVPPDETTTFTAPVPSELSVGKYKAFLSLEYGTDQLASLNDTVFFYVMPIPVMIGIFLGLLGFAVLLTVVLFRRAVPVEHNDTHDVSMYIRQGVSEAQDHDIDLKQNKTQ